MHWTLIYPAVLQAGSWPPGAAQCPGGQDKESSVLLHQKGFGRFRNPSHAGWAPQQMFSKLWMKSSMFRIIFLFHIYIVIRASEILFVASKEESVRSTLQIKLVSITIISLEAALSEGLNNLSSSSYSWFSLKPSWQQANPLSFLLLHFLIYYRKKKKSDRTTPAFS